MDNIKNAKNRVSYIKKVIKEKNKIKKDKIKKKNSQKNIVLKCNKKITKQTKKDIEILNKINEFNTNGKKTIVYFIDSYYPVVDGVVSVLENYANFMSEYFNVVVCCPKHKNKTYVAEKYFVLSANSIFLKSQGYDFAFPQLDVKFLNYISNLKIDLIHINAPFSMGNFGLDLAKKRKVPSITTFHSQFRQDFYKSTKNEFLSKLMTNVIIKLYDKSNITVTMNKFTLNIMKQYGLKRDDVRIIPNATNLTYKDFDKEYENRVLKKYKIDKNKFSMIYIGRFVKVKNVYLILDVLKELYEINKNFQFIFLGYGPEEEKMKKFVKENHLENNIIFTGKIIDQDEKSIIIKNNDLLFFPSTYDTDGIIKIECACYEIPTLCIEQTGVASGLVDNETGFIEKNDNRKLVERLDMLSKNVDLVQKIGKNAKEKIYITWEDVGKKLLELYEEILNKKVLKKSKKKVTGD